MKKFKHRKTGWIAKESFEGNYWIKDEMESHCIPAELVEDSADWEEVIEKDYEILSYQNPDLPHVIFRLNQNGDYVHHLTYLIEGHGCVIHSVKRLSDGEIFTVKDNVRGVCEKFIISGFETERGWKTIGALRGGREGTDLSVLEKVTISERKVDKYTYEGKTYVILGYVPFKDTHTRQWLDAVHYLQLESELDFVREKKEFFEHFKLKIDEGKV